MIWKNKNWTKRDHEATNVVACESEECPDPKNWVEADESVLDGLTALYRQGGVRFYGYL